MRFSRRIYSALSKVPYGKVTTYKELAKALNCKAYRAVGNALNRNKDASKIKCFKVVKSDGSIGGYAKGVKEKIRRLKEEGIEVSKGKVIDLKKKLFKLS